MHGLPKKRRERAWYRFARDIAHDAVALFVKKPSQNAKCAWSKLVYQTSRVFTSPFGKLTVLEESLLDFKSYCEKPTAKPLPPFSSLCEQIPGSLPALKYFRRTQKVHAGLPPAFTSLCEMLPVLPRPLPALTYNCGTLAVLPEPVRAFARR